MEYTYMGLFATIFGWVFDAILSPVFDFVAGLISDALSAIFNKVLAPLLTNVFWPLFQDLIKLILNVLGGIIYSIFAKVLFLLDTMNQTFNYLIGLETVSYKGQRNLTLIEVFFQIDAIKKAFWIISFMSLGLAMVFSIYAVIKSTLDFDFENKRPVSRVMSSVMKCFVNLFTVQFFIYVMLSLSTAVLKGIDTAMNASGNIKGNMSMGSMIFAVSSLNAARDSSRNLETASQQAYQSIGVMDSLRKPFFYGESPKVYSNISTVKEYFELGKFDYLIGFLLAFFLMVVMAACLMIFVQRMFDMLMLYVASPLFVSMIPLDDGERFGRWREMFIGKCFSGFGMVLAMKLYLILCPQIMTSDVQFSESVELDSLAKMVFLLGGAYAVRKAGTMVTSLISAGAAGSEQATGSMVTNAGAALGGYMAGKAADQAISKTSSLFRRKSDSQDNSDSTQGGKAAFEATKFKGESRDEAGYGSSDRFSGGPRQIGGSSGNDSGSGNIGGSSNIGGDRDSEKISSHSADSGRIGVASDLEDGKRSFNGTEIEMSDLSHSEYGREESSERKEPSEGRHFELSGSGAGTEIEMSDLSHSESGREESSERKEPSGGRHFELSGSGAGTEIEMSDLSYLESGREEPSEEGFGKEKLSGEELSGNSFVNGSEESSSSRRNVVKSEESAAGRGTNSSVSAEPQHNLFFKSTAPIAGKKVLRKGFFGFKKYKYADGSTNWNLKPGRGKWFNVGRDEKGMNIKILGFGLRWGKDGKLNKVTLPTTRLKLGSDEQFHVSKVNAGIVGFKANSRNGKLSFSSCNLIGLRRKENEHGKFQVTHMGRGALSVNKEIQEDGKFHTTSVLGGLYQKSFYKEKDGKLKTAGVRALGINFYLNDDVLDKWQEKQKRRGENN